VLVRAIRLGELDRLIFPEASLDILAQQIVACCAASGSAATANKSGDQNNDGWDEDALFALVKRAYPYRNLKRETFDEVLVMLSEGIASSADATAPTCITTASTTGSSPVAEPVSPPSRAAARFPTTLCFTVVAEPDGGVVGTVDEDFAVESMAGEVMLLGNTSWRIRRIEGKSSRIIVEDAHGAPPGIPFWRGEAPPAPPNSHSS